VNGCISDYYRCLPHYLKLAQTGTLPEQSSYFRSGLPSGPHNSEDTCPKSYFKSAQSCNVDTLFSTSDLSIGVAEQELIPYLALNRGF
jgi:hypothetical protein